MNKQYQNKQWLCKKYYDENLSTSEIGEVCGVTDEPIRRWLIRFNKPRRSLSESIHLSRANHCNLSQKAIEWFNGELLGDGNLSSRSPYSARFAYTSKYIEYAEYVRDTLESFGIEQSGIIRRKYHKDLDCYTYHYRSLSYVELLPIRKKWYPNGKKIIPRDLELTPLTLRQEYIGDGLLYHAHNGRPNISLYTCGFNISDVEWLIKQLIELEFKATRRPSDNSICISAYSAKDFLNYIGECPVKCYQYKWNYPISCLKER